MKYLSHILAALSLLFLEGHELKATTFEIAHFAQIEPYLQQRPLLILDIDNTLMEPTQTLGSDQWFYHRYLSYQKNGEKNEAALDRALSEWTAIQSITKVKTVEDCIATLVSQLQKQKLPIMGLTTRGLGLARTTIEQLHSLDIDLAKTAPESIDISFKTTQRILFREGILFTAGSNKGEAFLRLLQEMQYSPSSVVFVNDKATHIKEVEIACEEQGIPFVGLRYGFLDDKVQNFREEIADKQFEQFKCIMSDNEAQNKIQQEIAMVQ